MENSNYTKLRGGWDVKPDEFEAMGFVVGLPPNIYVPKTKEIKQLSDRFIEHDIQLANLDTKFSVQEKPILQEKQHLVRCHVTSLPNISEEELKNAIINRLFKKSITDEKIIHKIKINKSKNYAHVDFYHSKDAEKFLELKDSFQIDGVTIRVRPSHNSSPNDYNPYIPDEPFNGIIIDKLDVTLDPIKIKQIKDYLEQIISNYAKIKNINIPLFRGATLGYALVELENEDLCDYLILKLGFAHGLRCKRIFEYNGIGCKEEPDFDMDKKINAENGEANYFVLPDNYDISDILNLDVTITRKSSQNLYQTNSRFLKIYNLPSRDISQMSEIVEDMRDECSHFGRVIKAEVYKIFDKKFDCVAYPVLVEFATHQDAINAQIGISGRKYMNNIVITCNEDP